MMKNVFLVGLLMSVTSLFSSQVTIVETSLGTGLDDINCQSVYNMGETVYVGGLCTGFATNPLELNVYRSEDDGGSWANIQYADVDVDVDWAEYLYVKNLTFLDGNVGIASCSVTPAYYCDPPESQFIIKTTDAGASWDMKFSQPSGHVFENITDIDFFDDQNGIALGYFDNGGWFEINVWGVVTADQGESWTPIAFPQELLQHKTIQNFSIVDENTAYLVAQHAYQYDDVLEYFVYKSTDKGMTWESVSQHGFPSSINVEHADVTDVEFVNEDIGYISFSESYYKSVLIKTLDGGLTWEEVDHPLDVTHGYENIDFRDIYFVTEQEGYIIAGNYCNSNGCYRGYGILYTDDGGESWMVLDANKYSSCALVEMSFDASTGVGFAVGGSISGDEGKVFKIVGNAVGTHDVFDQIHVTVGPNPSQGIVTFTNNVMQVLSLNIYAMNGRLVKSTQLTSEALTVSLNKGEYAYKIESLDDGRSSKSGLLIIK
jgi:photosystem II stability/assembly factor-like uncharacterized protein